MEKSQKKTNSAYNESGYFDENALSVYLEHFIAQTILFVVGTTALLGEDGPGFVEEFVFHASASNEARRVVDFLVLIGSRNDMQTVCEKLDARFGLEEMGTGIYKIRDRSVILLMQAIGQGQGKSIMGIFEDQLFSFMKRVENVFTKTVGLVNLVKYAPPYQGMITSNGMTGFSTEMAMFIFNKLPRHLLSPTFTIYLIEDTFLEAQTEDHKLDLAHKIYLRVAHPNYQQVQLKLVPLRNPSAGLSYRPFLPILYNLRALQVIGEPDKFHDAILLANDITDLQRNAIEAERIFRSKEQDLPGASWINLNLTQFAKDLLFKYLIKRENEKEIQATFLGHIKNLNQFLVKAEVRQDEKILAKLIYQTHTMILVPDGFGKVVSKQSLIDLKELFLRTMKICETPFINFSIIEFPVKMPYIITEARIFPSVVIMEYLKGSSLGKYQQTAAMVYTDITQNRRGTHPLKKLADEYYQAAELAVNSHTEFKKIAEIFAQIQKNCINPLFSAEIGDKNTTESLP
jgi:hypothetical protein